MTVAVVWLASSLTRDASLIALVGLASRLPWLLFSLPAGAISDRYDRRVLVAWMDVARLGAVAAFAVVILINHDGLPTPGQLTAGADPAASAPLLLALLCLTALLIGFAEVVRDNAAQTLMPSIVAKTHLERANGRLWGAETTVNQFIGPPHPLAVASPPATDARPATRPRINTARIEAATAAAEGAGGAGVAAATGAAPVRR